MLNAAANPLANWILKDLFVWPQGRMTKAAYLGALLRILIVYVIAAQLLTLTFPILIGSFIGNSQMDMFVAVKWGQIGAVAAIAFPAWSVFQRRFNDIRPDLREKLMAWSIGFPLILAVLLCLMIVHAVGFGTPLDGFDLSKVRQWFAIMLVGAAFVPGGDVALASHAAKATKPQPNLFQTATQKAAHESLAAQTAVKPGGRHLPVSHVDRPKPIPATTFPQVIVRTRSLPQDGRVKPGWFS